jgi:hypothetical protein
MKEIDLDNSAEGKVLAKDITATSGQVLEAAGTVLTRKEIDLLRNRGVLRVCVEGDACDDQTESCSETGITATRDDCRKMLEKRFSEPPEGKMMRALFDAILEDMINREAS